MTTNALILAITVGVVFMALQVIDAVGPGGVAPQSPRTRGLIVCAALVGLSIAPYAVWFSRWNIPAHTQLSFTLVAYIIPIGFLGSLEDGDPVVVDLYSRIIVLGFGAFFIGVLTGAPVARLTQWSGLLDRVRAATIRSENVAPRRIAILALGCLLGMLLCFAYMGFVPALAADPFAAKFFRGAYAEAYAPVAPIYRFSTTVIALLLPQLTIYALRRREFAWKLLFFASVAVMLLSLLRDPAASGVLLAAGVIFATRGRGMWFYVSALVAVYFLGSIVYEVLASIGLNAFVNTNNSSANLFERAAAGAPDVNDQLTFMTYWLARPEYTDGWTFVGGLIPGNFHWNPSVWSLSIVNPGQAVSSVVSGGLRLPAPLWGYVSFGWIGVIGVSYFSGFFTGLLAGFARQLLPTGGLNGSLVILALYLALQDVLPVFYRLGYLSVIALAMLVYVYFRRAPSTEDSRTGLSHLNQRT